MQMRKYKKLYYFIAIIIVLVLFSSCGIAKNHSQVWDKASLISEFNKSYPGSQEITEINTYNQMFYLMYYPKGDFIGIVTYYKNKYPEIDTKYPISKAKKGDLPTCYDFLTTGDSKYTVWGMYPEGRYSSVTMNDVAATLVSVTVNNEKFTLWYARYEGIVNSNYNQTIVVKGS